MRKLIKLFTLSLFSVSLFAAETAPEVEAALNWNLPVNRCIPPPAFLGMTLLNEEGVVNSTRKLNPGQKRMAIRKKVDYDKCIIVYKNNLLMEMAMLKNVARHGLNKGQADTILTKMAFIQKVIESPLASTPESATE